MEIDEAIQAGRFQEAKIQLKSLFPGDQQQGDQNPHYARAIFELGKIAQLEGNDSQAEACF